MKVSMKLQINSFLDQTEILTSESLLLNKLKSLSQPKQAIFCHQNKLTIAVKFKKNFQSMTKPITYSQLAQ